MRLVPERPAIVAVEPLANTIDCARSRLLPFTVRSCPVTIEAGEYELIDSGPETVMAVPPAARLLPCRPRSRCLRPRRPHIDREAVGVRLAIVNASAFRRTSRTPSSALPLSVMRAGGSTVVGATVVTAGTATTVKSVADSTTRPVASSSMRPVLAPTARDFERDVRRRTEGRPGSA